jgi:tetratricopeptide (TPR) repeat protein
MSLCPGNRRSLDQLELLARDARIVFRDEHGFLEPVSGQRLLAFDDEARENSQATEDEESHESLQLSEWAPDERHQRWTFRDWFDQGRQLLEDGNAAGAVEAFRMCLMERPGEAEVHFHLAEALYRCGRSQAALERYYVAVEFDHEFIEAWTQLGCLHAELEEPESALEAFGIALDAHPDFPDAHWHKAEVLFSLERIAEAIPHWQRYLEFDSRGPWAETARQRLDKAHATVAAESV